MDEETEAVERAAVRAEASRNQTAKAAIELLLRSNAGFVLPTSAQKQLLVIEFAKQNFVVYGKAFDIVKLASPLDLNSAQEIGGNLGEITLCEIKSSNRKKLTNDFKGYFFALTAAELLVAQSLKKRFRFVFVNTASGIFTELTLQELLGRARGIYPTWSIMF